MSTSTVASRRPTLRWVPVAGTDGASVELCRDRGCTMERTTVTAAVTSVRVPSALRPGWWFWRLRARDGGPPGPTWQFKVGPRDADGDRDTSWGTELDLNGDGFADLAVFADHATDEPTGRVYLYFGSRAGLREDPDQTLEGGAVASAGDVNGDGFADLLVAAFNASPDGLVAGGVVSVYHGGVSGVATTPAWVLRGATAYAGLGASVAGLGDTSRRPETWSLSGQRRRQNSALGWRGRSLPRPYGLGSGSGR